jgi:anti-anti-sigma factor
MARRVAGKKEPVKSYADLAVVVPSVRDEVPVCAVRGEVDASNVDVVLAQLLECVLEDRAGLVLDLSGASYLDSAGVRILFELARRLRHERQELRVAAPPEGIIRRVLVLTALADVVPLHDDVASAVDALRARA